MSTSTTPPLTARTSPSPSPPASLLGTPSPVLAALELETPRERHRIKSVLMRAGTSKGLFFNVDDLPRDRDAWRHVLLAAMGSPDPSSRQLDGVGGGVSTASKVAVVSVSDDPEADVDYLFIQVPVDGQALDFSGNCGNIASGVGPYAVDEGLFPVQRIDPHEVTVRIRNVNTNRIIHSTFGVYNGHPMESGTFHLDGVSTTSSPIRLDFIDPAGSMTGHLLPTGNVTDTIQLASGQVLTVSCVDAANPFVFVHRDDLGLDGSESLAEIATSCTATLMEVRARMAVAMGLASSYDSALLVQGTPKIALVGPPCNYTALDGHAVAAGEADVWVRAFSMGKPHPAIQMTGAVCVGAASVVPGSLVHDLVSSSTSDSVVIGHASGAITVRGDCEALHGQPVIKSGSVYRTARRLMEGSVLYLEPPPKIAKPCP